MELNRAQIAIENSREWFQIASLAREAGLFSKAAFGLEMALEIGIKAVLIAMHTDSPKRHDVSDLFEETVILNAKRLPKRLTEDLESILSDFRSLLSMRSLLEYGHESQQTAPLFEKEVQDKFDRIEQYLQTFTDAVNRLSESP